MTITYAEAKSAAEAANFPVSEGDLWTGLDAGSFVQYSAGVMYNGGQPLTVQAKNAIQYGFAYSSEMPSAVADAVADANYSVTVAATPLSGASPLSVTATATEGGATASSYLWSWGDGTGDTTTTVPTDTHSYAAAGSFIVKMTPTVGGTAKAQVSAPAPVVVS